MSLLIVNAKVTRLDWPAAPSPDGAPNWNTGEAIAADAAIDAPTGSQKLELGADIRTATAVIYVLLGDLPDAPDPSTISAGWRITGNLVVDGADWTSVTYRVIKCIPRVLDELTHLELYCEVAS